MKAKDVMTPHVVSVQPDCSVAAEDVPGVRRVEDHRVLATVPRGYV